MAKLPKITVVGAVSILAMTIALGIYCSRPWGGNGASRESSDLIVLCGFMACSISPHIAMITVIWLLRNRPRILAGFCIGVSVLAVLGLYALFDAMFVHLDPQSGLVFLFVPLCQLLATLLLSFVCLSVRLGLAWQKKTQAP